MYGLLEGVHPRMSLPVRVQLCCMIDMRLNLSEFYDPKLDEVKILIHIIYSLFYSNPFYGFF